MNILHQFFQISTQVAATDDSMRSFLTKLMTNFSALLKMFRDPDLALRHRLLLTCWPIFPCPTSPIIFLVSRFHLLTELIDVFVGRWKWWRWRWWWWGRQRWWRRRFRSTSSATTFSLLLIGCWSRFRSRSGSFEQTEFLWVKTIFNFFEDLPFAFSSF